MTTIEVRPPGGSYSEIDYGEFQIEHGTSDTLLAPTARVDSIRGAGADVGDDLRITAADGTTQFEGSIEATPIEAGQGAASLRLEAKHAAYRLFDEEITFTEGTPTDDEAVLSAALSAATEGGQFTLDYAGTPTSLANAYDVERRPVKRVFRDMVEKTGRVWWIGVDNTIHVEPRGFRGVVATVDTATDDAAVSSYDPADVDTVLNDVTVTGTGDVAVSASATDQNSIDTYGPRSESPNYEFITSQSEAQELADALLQPVPLPSAEAALTRSVADTRLPLVNYELDITDAQGTTLDDTLEIQSQTVLEGYATVELGEGAGVNIAKYNRRQKSADDKTAPGASVDETRIADGSIAEPKLQDLAVSIDKIRDDAVTNPKVAQDAIQETEIKDDSISTPKLTTGAITTNKLDVGAVTAQIIDAEAVEAGKIAADAVGADEIIANTITADEIDTLNLDTAELSIGTTNTDGGIEFGIVTGTPLGDIAVMEPTADQAASVGQSGNSFYEGHFGSLFFAQATWDPGTAPSVIFDFDQNFNSNIYPETIASRLGTSSNPWGAINFAGGTLDPDGVSDTITFGTDDFDNDPAIHPTTDSVGQLGTQSKDFGIIYTSSIEASFADITSQLELLAPNGNIEFTIDSSDPLLAPTNDAARFGTQSTPWDTAWLGDTTVEGGTLTINTDTGSSAIRSESGVVGTELLPETDGENKVGNGNFQFDEMHAEQFISGGTVISDGGDVLAGAADATGALPPFARATPAEGNREGVSVTAAAEWATRATRAQQERIERLEDENEQLRETVADLEARLSDLESGPNA
jgi:hypothetical protein